MSGKKVFNFYYDLCCQKLTVYPGVTSEEIKSAIKEILEIPPDKKVNFLDEEGTPIVISSNLPNEIKIYVQIKKTFTEQLIEQNKGNENKDINSIEWFWNEEDNEDEDISYVRKNNNKTVKHVSGSRSSYCKGSLIMDSGEYYYTIVFEPLQCCVFATICPSNYKSIYPKNDEEIDWMDFWRIWPEYPDPHWSFPGPVIDAGFYVNMNSKLLIIYDNKKKKEIKRVNFKEDWNSVSPFVQFKHSISVTIGANAIKGKPSFIKIAEK